MDVRIFFARSHKMSQNFRLFSVQRQNWRQICWKANKSETLNSPHQTRECGHMEAGLRKLQKRRMVGISGQELYTSSTSVDLWMSVCPDLQADLREYVHIRGTFEVSGFRVWGDGSLNLRSRLVHGEPGRSIPWLISHSPSLSAAAFHWWSFQSSVLLCFFVLEYLLQRERERERFASFQLESYKSSCAGSRRPTFVLEIEKASEFRNSCPAYERNLFNRTSWRFRFAFSLCLFSEAFAPLTSRKFEFPVILSEVRVEV
jgi:hypothetical protein